MTARLLPPEQWDQLADTSSAELWPHLDPLRNRVLVVEERGGLIIGVLVLMQVEHAECLWIAPEHRGKSVVFRELRAGLIREALGPTVLAAADSDEMRGILPKLGAVPLPGEHYVLPLRGGA